MCSLSTPSVWNNCFASNITEDCWLTICWLFFTAELYNEAAEIAMMQQKGKLATKYYELAEEVYCME